MLKLSMKTLDFLAKSWGNNACLITNIQGLKGKKGRKDIGREWVGGGEVLVGPRAREEYSISWV